jgi:hypothetical protein
MQIGSRVFYDLTTGQGVGVIGKREGDVITTLPADDLTVLLPSRTMQNTGSVDLVFADTRFDAGYGSFTVNVASLAITVYALIGVSVDRTSITADGVQTATVTVTGSSDPVTFSVNGGAGNTVTPVNGTATFGFNTQVKGSYTIAATTPKNGSGSVTVQGV